MTDDAEREPPQTSDTPPPIAETPPVKPAIRTGERFDGGTDEDEKAGAGFGEGDDARRVREPHGSPKPD